MAVHLGIAQIAIGLPPAVKRAPIVGQNHANARLYMDISPGATNHPGKG